MRTPSALLAVVVASIAALACGGPPVDETDAAGAAEQTVRSAPTTWTFTKIPAPYAEHAVASPLQGLDAMVFEMTASGARLARVTRMAFLITGTLQAGEVTNYQLVHFPGGFTRPGVVVGSNDGATWAPGSTSSIVSIVLARPIASPGNGRFRADFALRADVNGARTFFFQPQLRTVTVEQNGVEQVLVDGTCDLPLPGDTFHVN